MTPSPLRPPLAVVCDFDETAAVQNVAHLLLARFAGGRDRQYLEAMREGRMSFRVYQEKAFDETRASIEEMQEYAREHARLRPRFVEAAMAARRTGAEFVVASAGLDFYVKAALERSGLGWVPVTAVGATRAGGDAPLRYDYGGGSVGCAQEWATCKCAVVDAAKASGRRVVFAGDGIRSDSCAAEKADVVFARAKLLEHCRAKGIAAQEFEDFRGLEELLDSGQIT